MVRTQQRADETRKWVAAAEYERITPPPPTPPRHQQPGLISLHGC